MNCIVIEDEAVAARRLKKLIERNRLEVLAVLHSVHEAVEWLRTNPAPDLLFLDIQLGDGISFEIFEHVHVESAIIFTTAYDKYALQAFKFNSFDYLLKPIQEQELSETLKKYASSQQRHAKFSPLQIQQLLQSNLGGNYRERFLVKIGQKLKTIESKDISLFYSENKGTYLQTKDRTYLIDFSLEDIHTQMNPKNFFRISRQALINIASILEITAHSGSRLLVKMEGSQEFWTVSREKVQAFKHWLDKG